MEHTMPSDTRAAWLRDRLNIHERAMVVGYALYSCRFRCNDAASLDSVVYHSAKINTAVILSGLYPDS